MSVQGLLTYVAFIALLVLLARPLGVSMIPVVTGQRTALDPVLQPVERSIYRLTGVDASQEMDWREYAWSFTRFGVLGILALYAILRLQPYLPWYFPAWQTTPLPTSKPGAVAVSRGAPLRVVLPGVTDRM